MRPYIVMADFATRSYAHSAWALGWYETWRGLDTMNDVTQQDGLKLAGRQDCNPRVIQD